MIKTKRMSPENFSNLCDALLAMGVLHSLCETAAVIMAVVNTDKGPFNLTYVKSVYKLYIEKGD